MATSAPTIGGALTRQLTGFADAVGDQGSSVTSPLFRGAPAGGGLARALQPAGSGFEVRVGGVTDPGVAGKQNQDDFFLWESADQRCIMCVVGLGVGVLPARAEGRARTPPHTAPCAPVVGPASLPLVRAPPLTTAPCLQRCRV